VDDVLDDLGSRREIDHLRLLLEAPHGTGADRQIAVYKETNSLRAVINFLMRQTMEGVTLEAVEQSLAG
jgi:carboxylate-amine ligase